ncbi:DUF3024 domain-containing protein [Corynebacterium lizhenjunii]|uniref:DUF3024 domain-containing protein n=1 Tax=Corynebacterium lizhenjunii TaxID=2709394 RepID=A0A7T0KG79_9CORY|nr:DUF3024 domain-containing protein [Corynebacterium lizhenjunii]QPK80009.1 DUF3024 domain-containing protein [Corynebacterium lizhenjunii]
MAISELDVARIKRWCKKKVPEHLWDQVKLEADVTNRHVTIVEVRPPWDGEGDPTRFPIARLRYTATTRLWSLYWRDRNLKFHEYDYFPPTQDVQSILDYLDNTDDPIFFG